jgi:glycosyltransferase involved in cell wall biosynthesis
LISRNKAIREIIFMEMDPYLVLINSPDFRKHHLTVNGILFQPYIHFEQAGNSWSTIRNKYKSLLLQKLSVRLNKNIRKIFILNDHEGVDRMNKRSAVYHYLPDPIQALKQHPDSTLIKETKKKYALSGDKAVILLFGGIDERKNVINLINSLQYLPEAISSKYQVVIAGRFAPAVREKFISHIRKNAGRFTISYFDGFISDEERDILFANAAIVFMAYINFFSSSGVIGHAMNCGKPVIVSDKGLVSRIISGYEMGIPVNPLDPKAIANAITGLTSPANKIKPGTENFIKEHSPDRFSSHLLS